MPKPAPPLIEGRPPWRPPKLTPQVAATIIAAVRSRNYLETAAALVDVDPGTLRRWVREGGRLIADIAEGKTTRRALRVEDQRKVDFCAALRAAEAEGEVRGATLVGRAATDSAVTVKTVTKAVGVDAAGQPVMATEVTRTEAPPDWRAEAWRLERRFPYRWGPTMRQEVAPGGSGSLTDDERIAAILDRLDTARGMLDTTATESPPAALPPG